MLPQRLRVGIMIGLMVMVGLTVMVPQGAALDRYRGDPPLEGAGGAVAEVAGLAGAGGINTVQGTLEMEHGTGCTFPSEVDHGGHYSGQYAAVVPAPGCYLHFGDVWFPGDVTIESFTSFFYTPSSSTYVEMGLNVVLHVDGERYTLVEQTRWIGQYSALTTSVPSIEVEGGFHSVVVSIEATVEDIAGPRGEVGLLPDYIGVSPANPAGDGGLVDQVPGCRAHLSDDACSTVEGAGDDVEQTAQEVAEAASEEGRKVYQEAQEQKAWAEETIWGAIDDAGPIVDDAEEIAGEVAGAAWEEAWKVYQEALKQKAWAEEMGDQAVAEAQEQCRVVLAEHHCEDTVG